MPATGLTPGAMRFAGMARSYTTQYEIPQSHHRAATPRRRAYLELLR